MADVMAAAVELCKKNAKTEREKYGMLLPCRKLSPLEPFIKLEEYIMLERDTGKYLLYMAAIDRAITDYLGSKDCTRSLLVKCLVLGPGLGRLVQYCLDVCNQHGANVVVHALEANPVAVGFLRNQFKQLLDKTVYVYDPFTFHTNLSVEHLPALLQSHCATFDLVLSASSAYRGSQYREGFSFYESFLNVKRVACGEMRVLESFKLLGCFGDDEFLPELTSSLHKMFVKAHTGIMIPESWSNYVVPVSSPSTYSYLRDNKKLLTAGYTMGLPDDCIFLTDAKVTWTGDCRETEREYAADLEFHINGMSVDESEREETASIEDRETRSQPCKSRVLRLSVNTSYQTGKYVEHCGKCKTCEMKSYVLRSNQTSIGGRVCDSTDQDTKVAIQSDHHGTRTSLHGFLGCFTSVLYKDIIIDTRYTSAKRNCFHWECYFFPLSVPVPVDPGTTVRLELRRKCKEALQENVCVGLKLWYEWHAMVMPSKTLESRNITGMQQCSNAKRLKTMNALDGEVLDEDKSVEVCSGTARTTLAYTEDQEIKNTQGRLTENSMEETGKQSRSKHCSCSSATPIIPVDISVHNRNGEVDAVYLYWEV